MLRVISLGAGVQSSTMFLMACNGELPKPDAAIFADTQWEPKGVYRWLDRLVDYGAEVGIPIIRATAGNLRSDALTFMKGGPDGKHRQGVNGRWASLPLYVLNPDGSTGIINRQCTKEYKIEVVEAEIRKMAGLKPRQRAKGVIVEQWIGISVDEASRMRDSRRKWSRLHYPLIYDFDTPMSRGDCKIWLTSNGYPIPPKSACIGCPFHSDAEWRLIKADPVMWSDAVDFDEQIRDCGGMRGKVFLHRSCRPLREIDFLSAEERGQLNWINECEGMCGV
jgi:hypothetical protein